MSDFGDKVECRTPTPGKSGVTRLPRWKYDAVRAAIVDVLAKAGADGFAFADLPQAVRADLDDDILSRLGSVGWHVTTVKLNMEVDGEITRLDGPGKQRLILNPG